jgi:hypothetical protein
MIPENTICTTPPNAWPPSIDIEKIPAECFRAVIFDGHLQERPDRWDQMRAAALPLGGHAKPLTPKSWKHSRHEIQS